MAAKTNVQETGSSGGPGETDTAGDKGGGEADVPASTDESTPDADENVAPPNARPQPPTTLMRLHQTKQWLQQQIKEHRVELQAAKDRQPPSSKDPEQLYEKITELEQQLLDANMKNGLRELLVNRLKSGKLLREKLFPSQSEKDEMDAAATEKQKKLLDLVHHQMELISQIIATQTDVEELQSRTDEVKMASFGKMVGNRELMRELHSTKQQAMDRADRAADTERIQVVKNKLSVVLDRAIVVRHMFQGLILGSGINWASDPDQLQLVLSLGRPIDTLLDDV